MGGGERAERKPGALQDLLYCICHFIKIFSTYKNKHSIPLQLSFPLVLSTAIFSLNLGISPRTAEHNELHHNPASSLSHTSLSAENTRSTY